MEVGTPISERLASSESEMRATGLADLLEPGANAFPHLSQVGACLADASKPVRLLALVVLGRIAGPASDYLASALEPQQSDEVRAVAASMIAAMSPPPAIAVRPLCRCLTSADQTLRQASAIALAHIGGPAVPALQVMLRFPSEETIAAALQALAILGTSAAASAPEVEAVAAAHPTLQLECAAALVRVTGDAGRGLPELLRALDGSDATVRALAAERIAGIREHAHAAIPNLLRRTTDHDGKVRAAAVLSLGRIRAPHAEVVAAMGPRLDDSVAEVRYNTLVVLASYSADARPALPAIRARLEDPLEKIVQCARAAIQMIESNNSGASGPIVS